MNFNRQYLIGVSAVFLAACGPFRGNPSPAPAARPTVAVVPAPASLRMLDGAFVVDSTSSVLVDSDAAWPIANTLARMLRVPTGYMINVANATGAVPRHGIRL